MKAKKNILIRHLWLDSICITFIYVKEREKEMEMGCEAVAKKVPSTVCTNGVQSIYI